MRNRSSDRTEASLLVRRRRDRRRGPPTVPDRIGAAAVTGREKPPWLAASKVRRIGGGVDSTHTRIGRQLGVESTRAALGISVRILFLWLTGGFAPLLLIERNDLEQLEVHAVRILDVHIVNRLGEPDGRVPL